MPENNNNILKQLQSYQVEPPAPLFDKVWQVIGNEDQALPNMVIEQASEDISTNSKNDAENPDIDIIETLRALQNYELGAPPFDYKAITASTNNQTQGRVVSLSTNKNRSIYKIAAAAFVIALASWAIYTSVQKKNDSHIASVNTPGTTAIDNSSVLQKKNAEEINVATSSLNKNNNANKYVSAIRAKNNMPVLTSDAQFVNAENSDLFVTLVNYNYTESSAYLKNSKKTQRIKLDQYSYVTVSDKMAEVLKKMYATKKNKKPTWKARRTKAMLKKWKKQDEKNFDRNTRQNPIDIIDLSEFILK